MNTKLWDDKINELISRGLYQGAYLQVHQNKQPVFSSAYGYNDRENKIKFTAQTKTMLYSLTKPTTTFAFMILVDRGLVSVEDNVETYLPYFSELKYFDEETNVVKPCTNKLQIKHLLTMTSGYGYDWDEKNIQSLQIGALFKRWTKEKITLQEWAKEVVNIPVKFEPGTKWEYGISLDILGAIIEKITNERFEVFLQKELFDRLGMYNTGFYFQEDDDKGIVYFRQVDGSLKRIDNFHYMFQDLNNQPNGYLGGASLITTAEDYCKFLDAMMDGKDQNNQTMISSKTLVEMKKDQIGIMGLNMGDFLFNADYGYGYGIRVRNKNELYPLTNIGEYGWDGYLGSTGISDDEKQITATLVLTVAPGQNDIITTEFFEAFYQGLTKN